MSSLLRRIQQGKLNPATRKGKKLKTRLPSGVSRSKAESLCLRRGYSGVKTNVYEPLRFVPAAFVGIAGDFKRAGRQAKRRGA